jgi:hypothetical protein
MTTIAFAVAVGDGEGPVVAEMLGAGVGLGPGFVELLLQPPTATTANINNSATHKMAALSLGGMDNLKT